MIVNISEACAHLGYRSRSTVQRLIQKGHLDGYLRPGGGRAVLLETDPPGLPSLRSAVQGLTQIRYDSPLWQQPRQLRGGASWRDQRCGVASLLRRALERRGAGGCNGTDHGMVRPAGEARLGAHRRATKRVSGADMASTAMVR